MNFLWVFIGGGLGSICRYSISLLLPSTENQFPWATFWANIFACLLLGLIGGWLGRQAGDSAWALSAKWLIASGFCGGFSTFSTFANETLTLLKFQNWGLAVLYVVCSIAVGLLALFLGYQLLKS